MLAMDSEALAGMNLKQSPITFALSDYLQDSIDALHPQLKLWRYRPEKKFATTPTQQYRMRSILAA